MGRSPVGCVRASEELNSLFEAGVQLYYVSALGRLCVVEKVRAVGGRVLATMRAEHSGSEGRRARIAQSCRVCGLDKSHERTERAGYFFSTPEAAVKYAAWVKEGVRVQRESEK